MEMLGMGRLYGAGKVERTGRGTEKDRQRGDHREGEGEEWIVWGFISQKHGGDITECTDQ